jgi:ubiquinone/menaquinone biosynthesis C-methylase UbiE
MPAHYDDSHFSYTAYWQGRDYEHQSELQALTSLLTEHKFKNTTDIGGGYGRLVPFLTNFSRHVTLIEPSVKQRKIASNLLNSYHQKVSIQYGTAQKLPLPDNSQDLLTVIRVMHHLPDPLPAFNEMFRVLKPGGILILEFANSHHLKARLNSFLSGQPLLLTPIERRSSANIKKNTIPFVNHAPQTIIKQLNKSGFKIIRSLSVSNFRSPLLKTLIPLKTLLFMESKIQHLASNICLGPSIFLLCQKAG